MTWTVEGNVGINPDCSSRERTSDGGPGFPPAVHLSTLVFLVENIPVFLLQLLVNHRSCVRQMFIECLHARLCSRPWNTALKSTNRLPLPWHLHPNGETDHKQRKETIRNVKSAMRI